MRILFSTDQVYLHGGIEKVMAEKANYFVNVFGYEVYVLTTEQKGKKACYSFSEKVIFTDLAINYNRKKSYFHPENLKKVPLHYKRWKKAIIEINPNFIISCNYAFDFYWIPYTFKKIHKFKEFHSSRYLDSELRKRSSLFAKFQFKLNDFIESKYTKLIVLNTDEAKYFKSNNVAVIPNPITINNDLKAKLLNKKAIIAGRIVPVKGLEKAIEAWRKVIDIIPNWELHIYGQGENEYISKLQVLIENLKLKDKVVIYSAVEDLEKTMLDYSFYLMSSQTECFPMVLLESLAVGLPIISFDCPNGPKNIITDNEDGFLVENQNSNLLAEKILFLINHTIIRTEMGRAAKKNSSRFSAEIIMKLWQNLFLEINN